MIPSSLIPRLARPAAEQGLDPASFLAVIDVESGGRIFAEVDGRQEPLIRFEGHYFDRRLSGAGRAAAREAGLAHPRAGMVKNPASQAARYRMLAHAEAIDRTAARESCSWGIGQVMGAHWAWLGYPSVDALVAEARAGAEGQARLMLTYIGKANLTAALAARDWAAFARAYNGPAYAGNGYDRRLAAAFARYAAIDLASARNQPAPHTGLEPGPVTTGPVLARGSRGNAVATLQRHLSALGYPLPIDGTFGPQTERAVRAFQSDHGLAVDGIAGPRTLEGLRLATPGNRLWRRLLARVSVLFSVMKGKRPNTFPEP
ncbi:peptidoglycan-binding protein [Zhengella mangrovi]|uniref:Peptidoglycan-binding protein n=1 Tax=Zhengella mangrovi TaxID=1982044 RepID=A0A2G1QP15_9HYPH|nr:N-acetylmuramidase domain-containing protein [Zhengella mangrovi]PHP67252.1 peptidoglycan-binding protein [Zhengella mangrovi]